MLSLNYLTVSQELCKKSNELKMFIKNDWSKKKSNELKMFIKNDWSKK